MGLSHNELKSLIETFYDKWKNTNNLWRKEFFPEINKGYKGYKIKISFGQGVRITPPKSPWICFLKYNQKVSRGVYPSITLDTKTENLFTSIGFSEESEPNIEKNIIQKLKETRINKNFEVTNIDELIKTLDENLEIFDKNMNLSNVKNNQDKDIKKQHPLNQILYGPPGTGKTYNTINKALEIIDGVVPEDREDARERFNELREERQIEFITFHQSYGYEEFVEGIKADLESEAIKYIREDGIFKKLVEKALQNESINLKVNNYIDINQKFKTTKGKEFSIVKIENNRVTIKNSNDTEVNLSIAKIREYLDLKTFRSQGLGSNLSYEPAIAKYIFAQLNQNNLEDNTNKNYILIIDEINRGNISKIFGELITLIEPSKRIGTEEALKLTLPNSKDSFGVPSNLYIIGTMNTADRSIAQIDQHLDGVLSLWR